VWGVKTRRVRKHWSAHGGAPLLSVHSLSPTTFLSQGRDGVVSEWDFEACLGSATPPSPRASLPTGAYNFCKCRVLDAHTAPLVVSSCDETGKTMAWDLRSPAPALELSPPEAIKTGMVMALCTSSSHGSSVIGVGYESGAVALYDVATTSVRASAVLHSEPSVEPGFGKHSPGVALRRCRRQDVRLGNAATKGRGSRAQWGAHWVAQTRGGSDCRAA